MASTTVEQAFRSRLVANWTRVPESLVFLGEIGQVPASGEPFLTIEFPASTETPVDFGDPGNNRHREEGGARFVLAFPSVVGPEPFKPWLDEIRALFRSKIFDEVKTFGASPAITDDRDDGLYWLMSSVVEYQFDVFG